MSGYTGVKCPVCGNKFTQADDIVVCPLCGAPHHRACYAEKGECAFAAEHLSGKEWSPPETPPEQREPPGERNALPACPRCGSKNPENVIFCQICGSPMSAPQKPQGWSEVYGENENGFYGAFMREFRTARTAYGGLKPDEEIDGETVRDLAAYIGENSAYYLPRFKLLFEASKTITFNLSALIFSFLFYFNRKMYVWGAFLLALFLAAAVPGVLQTYELMPEVMHTFGMGPPAEIDQALIAQYANYGRILNMIYTVVAAATSLFANRFYFNQAVRQVADARIAAAEGPHNEAAYVLELSRRGGVNKAAVIAIICGIFAVYFIFATVMTYQFFPMA
jgi:ribosomal protein S27E